MKKEIGKRDGRRGGKKDGGGRKEGRRGRGVARCEVVGNNISHRKDEYRPIPRGFHHRNMLVIPCITCIIRAKYIINSFF